MASITGAMIAVDLRFTSSGLSDKIVGNVWQKKGSNTINFDNDCPYGNGDKVITITRIGPYYELPAGTNSNLVFNASDDWTIAFWFKRHPTSESGYDTILNGKRHLGYQRISLSTWRQWLPGFIPRTGHPTNSSYEAYSQKQIPIEPTQNDSNWQTNGRYHYISFQKKDDEYIIHIDGERTTKPPGRLTAEPTNVWDFNTGGTGLFNESNGDNNAYIAGQFFDIVVIKGKALWYGNYYNPPTKYLTEDGYDPTVCNTQQTKINDVKMY